MPQSEVTHTYYKSRACPDRKPTAPKKLWINEDAATPLLCNSNCHEQL